MPKRKKKETKVKMPPKKKQPPADTHEENVEEVSKEECLLKELAYMTSEFYLIYNDFKKKIRR